MDTKQGVNKLNIKEVYVEAKKSHNFQTYTMGLTIILEKDEEAYAQIQNAKVVCRNLVIEEIKKDTGRK